MEKKIKSWTFLIFGELTERLETHIIENTENNFFVKQEKHPGYRCIVFFFLLIFALFKWRVNKIQMAKNRTKF